MLFFHNGPRNQMLEWGPPKDYLYHNFVSFWTVILKKTFFFLNCTFWPFEAMGAILDWG